MIAVIDYEAGNLGSVYKAFKYLGKEVCLTKDPDAIKKADGIVLPGVGAFASGMASLKRLGLQDVLRTCLAGGTPFLGICLGLQLLFENSEENTETGLVEGLGICRGSVVRFASGQKIPQIGWNQIRFTQITPLFIGLNSGCNVYFLHSYYAKPKDAGLTIALTDYGIEYTSAVWMNNIFAVQFHPEKSGEVGLTILNNFCEVCS
jgi:glutamine amidotransferase